MELEVLGLVDDAVIYKYSPWASFLTPSSITFLISEKEGERKTSPANLRSCGEASHEIICVKGFVRHSTSCKVNGGYF